MALGPGKYDELATYVREKTRARGVILIVLGGNKGDGFQVQLVGEEEGTGHFPLLVVGLLRDMADEIMKAHVT